MIRTLHKELKIPASSLIAEYGGEKGRRGEGVKEWEGQAANNNKQQVSGNKYPAPGNRLRWQCLIRFIAYH